MGNVKIFKTTPRIITGPASLAGIAFANAGVTAVHA